MSALCVAVPARIVLAVCDRRACAVCAAQAEKDLCDSSALDSCNVTAYQAKYPTAMNQPTCTGAVTGGGDCAAVPEFVATPTAANCPDECTFGGVVTSDPDTTVVTQLDLKPKSWTFLTATVGANVDMYHAKYSVGGSRAALGVLALSQLSCVCARAV